MPTTTTADTEVRYNVCCMDCGQSWQPEVRSPLWWRAKQKADEGYLDAVCVLGEECGCVPEKQEPDARYRVFGYTDDLCDFDVPHRSLDGAVRAYLATAQANVLGETFLSGVPERYMAYLRNLALERSLAGAEV